MTTVDRGVRGAPCGWVAMAHAGWRRPMAQNATGIEFGKSEHVTRWRISRPTQLHQRILYKLGPKLRAASAGQKIGSRSRLTPPAPPPCTVYFTRISPARMRGREPREQLTWAGPAQGGGNLGKSLTDSGPLLLLPVLPGHAPSVQM
jgi:hypothetical protein